MSYVGNTWIDRELEGEIANSETYEGVFALGMTALVETVRVGFDKVASQMDALGRLHALERKQQAEDARLLRSEVMELAAAVNQQTALLSKIHGVSMDDLWPEGIAGELSDCSC